MKGTLYKYPEAWVIHPDNEYYDNKFPFGIKLCGEDEALLDRVFSSTQEVEIKNVRFELMDEFSHPEQYLGEPLFEGETFAIIREDLYSLPNKNIFKNL